MTYEELQTKLSELRKELQDRESKLLIVYAKANNPIKIGDVVTDHIGTIVVEKISVSRSADAAKCMYEGTELTKKGLPKKGNPWRKVWQGNLVKL